MPTQFYNSSSATDYVAVASSSTFGLKVSKFGIQPDAYEIGRTGKRWPLWSAETLDQLRECIDAERAAKSMVSA